MKTHLVRDCDRKVNRSICNSELNPCIILSQYYETFMCKVITDDVLLFSRNTACCDKQIKNLIKQFGSRNNRRVLNEKHRYLIQWKASINCDHNKKFIVALSILLNSQLDRYYFFLSYFTRKRLINYMIWYVILDQRFNHIFFQSSRK